MAEVDLQKAALWKFLQNRPGHLSELSNPNQPCSMEHRGGWQQSKVGLLKELLRVGQKFGKSPETPAGDEAWGSTLTLGEELVIRGTGSPVSKVFFQACFLNL